MIAPLDLRAMVTLDARTIATGLRRWCPRCQAPPGMFCMLDNRCGHLHEERLLAEAPRDEMRKLK